MEKIFEEVAEMVQQGISKEELEQAKGFLSGKLQMGIESSDELADFLGEQYLQYQEIITLEEIVRKYEALTLEEVNGMCSLLTREHLYFFSLV
ncbi:MAG: hypothetical protein LBI53_03635 [Candidatus Peribacteria bacterium]|jgi:predicted Zn-dependent peptidase|nr:hypothetical protein [Candidatus Peribacteria bacterium]